MNIKKYLALIVLFLAFALPGMSQKIGYTNVEVLLAYMPEVEGVQKQLDNFSIALQKPITIKEEYYQTKMTEYYEKAQIGFAQGEEEQYQQIMGSLQIEIQGAYETAEGKLLRKQSELLAPIMTRIQNAINAIAEEEGYVYILNQTSGNNILFGLQSLDLTEKLARKLGIKLDE